MIVGPTSDMNRTAENAPYFQFMDDTQHTKVGSTKGRMTRQEGTVKKLL